MANYRLTIHFLGTRYRGWQYQKDQPTIQGELQSALHRICGEPAGIVGSGRTDSGVHARGLVAHFQLARPRPAGPLKKSLNAVLPWDIRITSLRIAPASFHARRDALGKQYQYRVYTGETLSPFLYGRVLHHRLPLDRPRMQRAADLLLGRHDFRSFAASASQVSDHHRSIWRSDWKIRGRLLTYQIEGEGFLHHMVRNLVGTMLEVGTGRRPPGDILRILESGDRRQAGPTAPPQGLWLIRVYYRRPVSADQGMC